MKVTFFIAWWKMKGSGTKCIVAFFCNQKLKSGKREKSEKKGRKSLWLLPYCLLTNIACSASLNAPASKYSRLKLNFSTQKSFLNKIQRFWIFYQKLRFKLVQNNLWIFKHKLCKNLKVKKVWIFTLKILIEVRCMSLFIRQ